MMRKITILATVLAVAAPALVFGAPALIDSFANYLNGRATPGALTGSESIGLVQSGATTKLTLSSLAAYLAGQLGIVPVEVALSGTASIPSGNHLIDAAGGSVLTLPAGAAVGTTEYVSDYQGAAGSAPITVNPSSDAAIIGTSTVTFTVPFQAVGFRRTAAAWQPY